MTEVNLVSLVDANKGLNAGIRDDYYNLSKISPKPIELDDLESFITEMTNNGATTKAFDRFYMGFIIPQISKEFDLLRFSQDSVVNIELKSIHTGSNMIKQLIRNEYYLSFLNRTVYCFTYVQSDRQLYKLDNSQNLVQVTFNEVINILTQQESSEIEDLNLLFDPSNYLVSPFNSTDSFLRGKYFLTSQQEEIKKKCLVEINKKTTSLISIVGKAGTGKTLLTYDIARHYVFEGRKVLIAHCGILNAGHQKLNTSVDWEIIPIKEIRSYQLSDYALVIVDETQRIFPHQLSYIINSIEKAHGNCIFSFDMQQCLRNWEVDNNISDTIATRPSSIRYELTDKIRTNKEIASFILALFNRQQSIDNYYRKNVTLRYFQNHENAVEYLYSLSTDWKVINYTPSKGPTLPYERFIIPLEDNAHQVIGQEFDKVVAVIDEHFVYKNEHLDFHGYKRDPYYNPVKMLFQIMTRTRKKLQLIVVNNSEIMDRCLTILNAKSP